MSESEAIKGLGFVAAACAACCVGPVVAFVTAASATTIALGSVVVGAGILVVLVGFLWMRRKRAENATDLQIIAVPRIGKGPSKAQ